MNEIAAERLRNLVSQNFPPGARILNIPRQADLVFAISWHLPSPGCRRSKTVRLSIADAIFDLYAISGPVAQRCTEARLNDALQDMLAAFDPAPSTLAGDTSEVVLWQLYFKDD